MAALLQQRDLLADIFEARKHAAQLDAVFLRNGCDHIGRDNGGDSDGIFRHRAIRDAAAADEVQQNDAHFVAGNEPVATLSVRHGGAAAVAVGVGTDENIGVDAVAVLKAQLHGLPDLRIRIRAGREMTVRLLLLLYDGHVPDAELLRQLLTHSSPAPLSGV